MLCRIHIDVSAIGTALCLSASLFFFYQKCGRKSMVVCKAINLFQFSPPSPAPRNSTSINYYVPIPLIPCIYDAKYAVHYPFSVFIAYIFAASLGMHFLPVRHGLVKERQAVTFRLRCQRIRAQGCQISSLITGRMVLRT